MVRFKQFLADGDSWRSLASELGSSMAKVIGKHLPKHPKLTRAEKAIRAREQLFAIARRKMQRDKDEDEGEREDPALRSVGATPMRTQVLAPRKRSPASHK